ncbi:hypothetical protein [Tepidimonas ignava]|nr:hypothetical protein [Tepidimonas ignava]
MKRLVAAVEMIAFYVVLLGCVVGVASASMNNRAFFAVLFVFAWLIAMFYVVLSPNEELLYRERLPEIVMWWLLGCVKWMHGLCQGGRE